MKFLCKNKNWKLNEDYDINKILYLLIDRPICTNNWNDFIWKNENGYHRNYDLPAVIHNDGYVVSWKNNKLIKNSYIREDNKNYISISFILNE